MTHRVVVSIAVAFVLTSTIALLLTRLGIFSGYLSLGLSAAAVLAVQPFLSKQEPWLEAGSVGLSFALATIMAAYSAYFMTVELDGGRDQGVYNLISHVVARSQQVNVDNPAVPEATDILGSDIVAEYPGIYQQLPRGLSTDPSKFTAQFNHLTAIFRAIFLDIWPANGLHIATALICFFAVFAFTLFSIILLGRWWGLLSGILLAFNAVFIYVARSSLTEVFCLGFFFFGLLFSELALRTRKVGPALLAGAMIGCVMLVRPDGYLVIIFPVLTILVLLQDERPSFWPALAILSTVTIFFIWSVFDIWWFSYPYYFDLRIFGLGELIWASGLSLGFTWVIFTVYLLYPQKAGLLRKLEPIALKVGYVGILFSAGIFVYLFFHTVISIRFGTAVKSTLASRASLEMTWYTTLPMMILAFVGALLLLRKSTLHFFPLVVTSISLILFFLVFSRVSPDHPWGARRWLPFAVPLVVLLATVALSWLWSHHRRAGLVCTVSLCVLYLYQQDRIARNWWTIQLQSDWKPQFDQTAASLKQVNAKFFAVAPPRVASVLNYVYGIPSVAISVSHVSACGFRAVSGLPPLCAETLSMEDGSNKKVSLVGRRNKLLTRCFDPMVYAYAPEAHCSSRSDINEKP